MVATTLDRRDRVLVCLMVAYSIAPLHLVIVYAVGPPLVGGFLRILVVQRLEVCLDDGCQLCGRRPVQPTVRAR